MENCVFCSSLRIVATTQLHKKYLQQCGVTTCNKIMIDFSYLHNPSLRLNQLSPNYGPLRFFIRPAESFLKNIYTHFEPQSDRIISGTLQFQFLSCSFHWRTHQDFGRKIAKLELKSK